MSYISVVLVMCSAGFIAVWLGRDRMPRGWEITLLVAVAATLAKLSLVSWQNLYANPTVTDDYLFLSQAYNIVSGRWLGDYEQFTLIKGPFYSIWIAAMFTAGVPLLLAQQLLYVFASASITVAVRPVLRSHWALGTLYLLVLLNPTSNSPQVARIDRFGIYTSLILLVHAGAIGLLLRFDNPIRHRMNWSIGLGVSIGLFLITREASVWIYPALLLLGISYLAARYVLQKRVQYADFAPIVVAVVLAVGFVQIISFINWKAYGLWCVTETRSKPFLAAYGALNRIAPKSDIPLVPVSAEARSLAYSVSGAFASLKPLLEGDLGRGWATAAAEELPDLELRGEIAGFWFMWAVRAAASRTGMHQSPKKAMQFYQQLADEINEACDLGRLRCYPERRTFAPVWDPRRIRPTLSAWWRAWVSTVEFEPYDSEDRDSFGQPRVLSVFRDIAHERLTNRKPEPAPALAVYTQRQRIAERSLAGIASKYSAIMPGLAALALAALLAFPIVMRRAEPRERLLYISAVAIFGTILGYSLMLAYIDATMFPAVRYYYHFPNHALLCVLVMVGLWLGMRGVGLLMKTKGEGESEDVGQQSPI